MSWAHKSFQASQHKAFRQSPHLHREVGRKPSIGNLWICGNHYLASVTDTGVSGIVNWILPSQAPLGSPYRDIGVDSSGNIYAVLYSRIGKFNPDGTFVGAVDIRDQSPPYGVRIDIQRVLISDAIYVCGNVESSGFTIQENLSSVEKYDLTQPWGNPTPIRVSPIWSGLTALSEFNYSNDMSLRGSTLYVANYNTYPGSPDSGVWSINSITGQTIIMPNYSQSQGLASYPTSVVASIDFVHCMSSAEFIKFNLDLTRNDFSNVSVNSSRLFFRNGSIYANRIDFQGQTIFKFLNLTSTEWAKASVGQGYWVSSGGSLYVVQYESSINRYFLRKFLSDSSGPVWSVELWGPPTSMVGST